MPALMRWGDDARPDRGLIAGEPWLSRAIAGNLPGAEIVAAETREHAAIIVAARGRLDDVSDEVLGVADLVVLLDPTPEEHLRAVQALAGRYDTRLVSLPSLDTAVVAEQAMTLMLALVRQLLPAYSALVSGARRAGMASRLTGAGTGAPNWVDMPLPACLLGKTLGIIGLGRAGQAVAARAAGFGMRLIYHDLEARPAAELRWGARRRHFDQVLREADVVSLHLPLTPETVRVIDAPELALMRPGSYLINTAHGRLIDEGSLIHALRERAIAGAGLDVFAYEPLSADSPLLGLDNVVLTPHLGTVPPEIVQADLARRAAEVLWSAAA